MRRTERLQLLAVGLVLLALQPGLSLGSPGAAEDRAIYDGRDASPAITRAVRSAARQHKRILLIFGANWCVWCRRLDTTFRTSGAVSRELTRRFEVVHIDTDVPANAAIIRQLGNPTRHGIPALAVLDETGQLLLTQGTGDLEIGNRHDPSRILRFLQRVATTDSSR